MPERSERLIGESSAFMALLEAVSQLSQLDKPVLIAGERGTGKEQVAARLHYLSERWGQPWLKLNCAAISDSLLDSELFGHEAGAFSGAIRQHKGYFERADGGTLFLDEISTTSLRVQEKVLRVVEYGELTRLGGDKVLTVDVRLIAATNEHLPSLVQQNRFRADLLDRLAFDVLTVPPLRMRKEDILILAEHFALGMIKELHRSYFPGFSRTAITELLDYHWPGNVRELKNVIERSVYRCGDADAPVQEIIFDPFDSPFTVIKPPGGDTDQKVAVVDEPKLPDQLFASFRQSKQSFKDYIRTQEKDILAATLQQTQFNQRRAADLLGLTYDQLRGYLRKYKL